MFIIILIILIILRHSTKCLYVLYDYLSILVDVILKRFR